jgi:hypothetical protein
MSQALETNPAITVNSAWKAYVNAQTNLERLQSIQIRILTSRRYDLLPAGQQYAIRCRLSGLVSLAGKKVLETEAGFKLATIERARSRKAKNQSKSAGKGGN